MDYTEIAKYIVGLVAVGVAAYFGAYLKQKGQSTATKEDIEEITRKIEEVRQQIRNADRVSAAKYQLKHDACLNALGILDAYLSHKIKTDNNGKSIAVDKQYSTPELTRKCHSDLLLTVENDEIVRLFLSMMTGGSTNLMNDLDKFRVLVRCELGFGKEGVFSDGKSTWMANIISKEDS